MWLNVVFFFDVLGKYFKKLFWIFDSFFVLSSYWGFLVFCFIKKDMRVKEKKLEDSLVSLYVSYVIL